ALTFVFKRIQHEWRNNSILAEKRHLLLSLYPVFFHGDDEVSHPNPARLREEIALYMVRALEAGAVQEIGEEELFFDPEFLQTISLSPDIYIGVGAEKLAPQDFVALTADLAGHFSGLGFHCMAAYFCQATWDAVVPSFEPCDPDLQTLFLRLAQSYHALGYYRQALDYFEKGLRIETEGRNRDAQAYRWLLECVASLHMVLGYYEQAKEILDLLSAETGSFQDIGEKTRLLIDFANEALG
ncbi:MAG: hypothetical protein U1D33_04080, partial [bacterium]|nr:hypothetical protein [bacterium]